MKLFVYGSLKRGFFNHTRFGFNKIATLIGEAMVSGVSLRHLSGYPYPHAVLDPNGVVEGELYELDRDSYPAESIERMELGAGYKPVEVVAVVNEREHTAKMYVANFPVESGEVLRSWTLDRE